MAPKTNAEKIRQGYINACNAVLGRGGSIASGAPIGDLADAIINIPHDTTLAYHEVNSTAYRSIVPRNAENRALVNKIGGKSYKTRNWIPFPYYANAPSVHNGITYSIQDNGTVVLNGVSTERSWRILSSELTLTAGKVYTLSGCPSGGSTTGATNPTYALYISEFKNGTWSREFQEAGNGVHFTALENCVYTVSVNVWSADVTCENLVFKPMLNEGDTALPYEPYFEGIRDTKVMALKSEGANLLPFPYYDPTITRAGITFTVNADRGITINGSNDGTANSFIYLVWRKSFKAGDYCLSIKDVNGLEAILYDGTSYRKIKNTVVTLSQDVDEVNIYLQIIKGTTSVFDNETVYPMLAHTPMEYKPYVGTIDTLAIPEAVQAIEGYGQSNPDNPNEYNYIDLLQRNCFTVGHIVDGAWVRYKTPIVTDISEYLTDEFIKVEGGGPITAVNEREEGVPTSVTYLIETVGG